MKLIYAHLLSFCAFALGRRDSMLLDFGKGCLESAIFKAFNLFFRKNVHFVTIWSKKTGERRIRMFAFRATESLEKFLASEKLDFATAENEKNTLLGEALGYPAVAVEDFAKLRAARVKDNDGMVKTGDRIGFNLESWGYDGFVFRPQSLKKIKKWCEEKKIPFEKVRFSYYRAEPSWKWIRLSNEQLEEMLETGKFPKNLL